MAIFSNILPLLSPGRRGFAAEFAVNAAALGARRVAERGLAEAQHGPRIDPALGAHTAPTVEDFVALAVRDDVPGAPRIRTVKFLMTGVDERPVLYLMQTNRFQYHYDF